MVQYFAQIRWPSAGRTEVHLKAIRVHPEVPEHMRPHEVVRMTFVFKGDHHDVHAGMFRDVVHLGTVSARDLLRLLAHAQQEHGGVCREAILPLIDTILSWDETP